ncbi:MAG: MBL fold metallo-hydrolase [Ruminiclostridium sp.]|nr:MBL fold metallo-hydrolase [Ruminiclostridium sp.]
MYELIQVGQRTYYINVPVKIGLYLEDDHQVWLIDSGGDKDSGRKIRQILDKQGWKLKAILNTHSNADHIGGNQYLQKQTGCKIYAPGIDCAFTCHPLLEPSYLFGGFPPKDLRHKFLMAQESDAEYLTQEVLPEGMQILPLPGHFFDMVGFTTPDGVTFLADCLSSKETLEKYQIGVIYDVEAYLDTLEKVKGLQADLFIPSHAEATKDIVPLAQYNIDKVHQVADRILTFCREPICFDALLQKLFEAYDLKMDFSQNVLVGSTVKSYLAWLKNEGKMDVDFSTRMALWKTVE